MIRTIHSALLRLVRRPVVWLVAVVCVSMLWALPAWAITYGSGPYGECQYGSCSITISSAGSVAANVTPSPIGACTVQSDTVSVFTDDPAGYVLSLANSSTTTSLLNGAATIGASTGSAASPTALVVNTWGFRVDGVGGFGAGPTTAQTNVSIGSTTFAGVPASSGTAATLASTSTVADPAVNTKVWYGVCANTSIKSGQYSTQVTYTAIAN